MTTILASILNFLAKPPGDLVYHLLVSLSLILTFGYALVKWGKPKKGSEKHTFLIGLIILIVLQIGFFALRSYNTETNFSAQNFYFSFERLVSTLMIIWLVWAFYADDQRELPTDLNIILSVTFIFLTLVSIVVRPRIIYTSMINPFILDLIWQFLSLVLVILGLILAFSTQPSHYKTLTKILLLQGLGHLVQILLVTEMSWYMGGVRLAQIIGMPLLVTRIKPLSSNAHHSQPEKKRVQPAFSNLSNRTQSAVNELLSQIKSAGASGWTRVKNLFQQNPKIIPEVELPENETIEEGVEMTTDIKPALVDMLLKISLSQSHEEKVQSVAKALSLSVVADICFLVRIPEQGNKVHFMAGYDLIREVLYKPDTLAKANLPQIMEAWQAHQPLELSQDNSAARDVRTLATLLNYYSVGNLFAYPLRLPENPLAGGVIFMSPYTGKQWGQKTRLLLDEIQDTLAHILFVTTPTQEDQFSADQAQLRINSLREEITRLRKSLAEKDALIHENEITIKGLKAKYQIEKMESVTRIEKLKSKIAELSTQVSLRSDVETQTEQLLTEIRQLTDEREQLRIALSRANQMITELRTESGQTGPIRLSLESQIISLDSIAANVRLRVATQIRQKNIVLEIHNPDGRQMIKTDPELLQTALYELLVNAIWASEPGGTIKLHQKLSLEMGMLIIQVTDFGEGLTESEQTALFSAQHKDIPGIGNVQSIRNAIRAIRVLNGKIWLKSEKAAFTTFRFQIPVRIID